MKEVVMNKRKVAKELIKIAQILTGSISAERKHYDALDKAFKKIDEAKSILDPVWKLSVRLPRGDRNAINFSKRLGYLDNAFTEVLRYIDDSEEAMDKLGSYSEE